MMKTIKWDKVDIAVAAHALSVKRARLSINRSDPVANRPACGNEYRNRRLNGVGGTLTKSRAALFRPKTPGENEWSPHNCSPLRIIGQGFEPQRFRQAKLNRITRFPGSFEFNVRADGA